MNFGFLRGPRCKVLISESVGVFVAFLFGKGEDDAWEEFEFLEGDEEVVIRCFVLLLF